MEQLFPVVLIFAEQAVPNFYSCGHSNESFKQYSVWFCLSFDILHNDFCEFFHVLN